MSRSNLLGSVKRLTVMTELTNTGALCGSAEPESVTAAVQDETSLVEAFDAALEISGKDAELTEHEASEETDSREKPEQDGQRDKQQNGPVACPLAADLSSSEPKWVVGARCQAVWSGDRQVYQATVVSVDGKHCRVHFSDYGNEEDMELSALKSPDAAAQTQSSQDWKPGSRCRAVYSEDGLVYPAVVLWVKDQRCRVRFDNYNNEEEQDVSSLLNADALHGPNRATAAKSSSWKSNATSSNVDWKRRRREENQGERGGERRSAWRDEPQNSHWAKERLANQSKAEKEADEKKRGSQQRNGAEGPTYPGFPSFPPPPLSFTGDPVSFIPPPPPPPFWMFGGRESGSSPGLDTPSSMLMMWYMCGFHTGSYMAQQHFRSFKD